MYSSKVINLSQIRAAQLIVVVACLGSFLFVSPTPAAAANETTQSVQSQRDQVLWTMIYRLQEMIITLQRKLTTIHGQKEGENLINENSIARTNGETVFYTEPLYDSEVAARQPAGVWGEVSAGPKLVSGEVWWQFEFKDDTLGWSPESSLTREASTVLDIDTDQDGESDIRIRLIGTYDPDGFVAEPTEDGTYIRYLGEQIEPYEIIEL